MYFSTRRLRAFVAIVALAGATAVPAVRSHASDHQDTAEVELNPRCDINDVYAFPGSSPSRLCIAMTTSSPIARTAPSADFDNDKLYQVKIDNTGDGVEDLVLQFLFDGTGSGQRVSLIGPVAPAMAGNRNRVAAANAVLTGPTGTVLGAVDGVQLFCGLRDDPFFLDLEQFFRILPDRRPASGPLSVANPINPPAWRDPAPDYLAGFNTLAIVVELPAALLTAGGSDRIGIWGTVSR